MLQEIITKELDMTKILIEKMLANETFQNKSNTICKLSSLNLFKL